MEINIDNYVSFQHPCAFSTPEKPRGGCIMFIKHHLMKFVENVDKQFNNSIIVYMCYHIIVCGFYIPPVNSKYFDQHFNIMETYTVSNKNVIVCGDLN